MERIKPKLLDLKEKGEFDDFLEGDTLEEENEEELEDYNEEEE